ncbi:MAG: reverse transcriptase domain-containing protein, partial [Arsenophonus sp. NC-XBC3-MAG3]
MTVIEVLIANGIKVIAQQDDGFTPTQNYFTYNDKCYTQYEGLPMGSSISSILADTFLHQMEQHTYHTIINTRKNIYWHRYVNDIIILYNGNNRQLEQLHRHINKIHKNLTFTLDLESDHRINYLDLIITKINNKHKFKIYKKFKTTDTIIHYTSNH